MHFPSKVHPGAQTHQAQQGKHCALSIESAPRGVDAPGEEECAYLAWNCGDRHTSAVASGNHTLHGELLLQLEVPEHQYCAKQCWHDQVPLDVLVPRFGTRFQQTPVLDQITVRLVFRVHTDGVVYLKHVVYEAHTRIGVLVASRTGAERPTVVPA